jgi:hypothetical protein
MIVYIDDSNSVFLQYFTDYVANLYDSDAHDVLLVHIADPPIPSIGR